MMVLYAVVLPVIILFCGLTLDVGMIQLKKIQLQSAADSAAIEAEMEAERGTGYWVNYATLDSGVNGFTNGSSNVSVSVSQFPATGPYTGRYDALQATVSQNVHTIFMGALNGGSTTVTAQGVALMVPCVFLLGTGTLQYYMLDLYSGDLDGNSCPDNVNLRMRIQPYANAANNAYNVSGAASDSVLAGAIFPYPNFNAPAMTDPLASVTSPSFNGICNHLLYSVTGVTATLNPGNYCGGITLTNSTITLNPGLYVITGGSLWTNSTVTGNGVTLFFTLGGGYGMGKFITSYGTTTLNAPTDSSNGGIPGISVFADRNWIPLSPQDFAFLGGTFNGDGILYTKGAGVFYFNCGLVTAPNYFGIVADNIYAIGTDIEPRNNYGPVSGGNPMRHYTALVQ
jgi:hypothetical protein